MTKYDTEAFGELNRLAAEIGRQNWRYDEAGKIKHPRFAGLRQNEVAAEQAEHISVLGELSAELPYEELAREHMAAEAELQAAHERLLSPADNLCFRKMGVIALADEVIKVMPWCEEYAQVRVAERLAEIDALTQEELTKRVAELGQKVTRLSGILEVAGQPWPVPHAVPVEVPADERWLPRAVTTNGNGSQPEVQEPQVVGECFEEPDVRDHVTVADRVKEFISRRRYAPKAKYYIAWYLAENQGRTVSADELVDFVYSHVPEDEKPKTLRNSITTMLGPKLQGQDMRKLLAKEGLVLQYGWQELAWVSDSGEEKKTRRRAYRAVPMAQPEIVLPEFTESVQYEPAAEAA